MKYLSDSDLEKVVGGLTVIAEVGMNSPNGSHFVTAPAAAVDPTGQTGILNAFNNVVTKGPGDLSNINIILAK